MADASHPFTQEYIHAVGITRKGNRGGGKGVPVRTSLCYADALSLMDALNAHLPPPFLAYLFN